MKGLLDFFKEMVKHQRKWFAQWHAWAGIFAGSVLIIVGLTGAFLSFEEELDVWLNPELFVFEEKSATKLSLDDTFIKVANDHPTIPFSGIFHFPKRDCYIANYTGTIDGEEQFYQAIVNPYTGEVTGIRIYNHSIMGIIRNLHRTLLIPVVGKYIVGFSSLFMVILMITGLRLWIPKHWNMLKERLTIKKGASFKRQNYDLHNALGFYFSPFITLIAMTGVAITFSNFVILTLFIVNFQSPQSIGAILGKKSEIRANTETMPLRKILEIANEDMPHAEIRGFSVPLDSAGAFTVNFIAEGRAKTGDNSFATYDQYNGKRLLNTDKDFANTGKLALNWLTAVHYGTFGGLPTRIVALLSSFVAPILFITGFIIWWGRWKKRKCKKVYSQESNISFSNKETPISRPIITEQKQTAG